MSNRLTVSTDWIQIAQGPVIIQRLSRGASLYVSQQVAQPDQSGAGFAISDSGMHEFLEVEPVWVRSSHGECQIGWDYAGGQSGQTVQLASGSEVAITTSTRYTSFMRVGGVGTVFAGSCSVAFANAGGVDVTVASATLKPGEQVRFEAPLNDTLSAIAYDATGGDLIISEIR